MFVMLDYATTCLYIPAPNNEQEEVILPKDKKTFLSSTHTTTQRKKRWKKLLNFNFV
jgi:hypothetical protein